MGEGIQKLRLLEVENPPGEMAALAAVDPVLKTGFHPFDVILAADSHQIPLIGQDFFQDPPIMSTQVFGEVLNGKLFKPEAQQHILVARN